MAEVVVFGVVASDVVLRVQRIPAAGDQVDAEALGWRIGGSSANVACGLSSAGHHVRLVGPVGTDAMGDHLLAELERCGVDTEYAFRADAASPRTLICSTTRASARSSRWTAGLGRGLSCPYVGRISGQLIVSTSRVIRGSQPAQRPRLRRLFS